MPSLAPRAAIALSPCCAVFRRQSRKDQIAPVRLNGIEAMQGKGGELTVASKKTEGNQLVISVNDTGIGLSTEEAERIFEAYYTTKPQGTGMGLSISRRIIASHGGDLVAIPAAGRGATFQFTLPVEATTTARDAPAADHHRPRPRSQALT
jgi:signal transduction histidine kinase